ncbi:MAG: uncharacterized protein QOE47_3305 [Pyrinomonadaceae bacterium]|nr:uncharacterized protein [Pyrinomonadaceae bacterium]
MQRIMRLVALCAVFALAASGASAQIGGAVSAGNDLPARPKSFVGDFANAIDARAERQLETKLAALRKRAAIEFVVVTIETTGGEEIFDYSLNAARRWRLAKGAGDKGGILLMLAIRDRKWRVQLTDSLRVDLPEEVLKIHGDRMSAPFGRGGVGAGVNVFVDGIIAHLAERGWLTTGAK